MSVLFIGAVTMRHHELRQIDNGMILLRPRGKRTPNAKPPPLPPPRARHSRSPTSPIADEEEDPFEPTGFITAFSAWSLEPNPIFARSSLSFSGHLAEHAFELFRDCCSATCLRNRSVEALATACLVQAIREAQEPPTLQEISIASNVQQKEIGNYIKILGEALQLSQPINSNSVSVHMPRFCTLLQLNKSAQELATHIGEMVINKCSNSPKAKKISTRNSDGLGCLELPIQGIR